MNLKLQKKLAADVLGCSPKRVWVDPEAREELNESITKADIKSMIKKGYIAEKPAKSNSRGRARKTAKKKSRGQRKGHGSRKGTKKSRTNKKEEWMNKIRLQRKILAKMKETGLLSPKDYRKVYSKAKSGFFRNKRHLKLYLEKENLIQKERKTAQKSVKKKTTKKQKEKKEKKTKTKKSKSKQTTNKKNKK